MSLRDDLRAVADLFRSLKDFGESLQAWFPPEEAPKQIPTDVIDVEAREVK